MALPFQQISAQYQVRRITEEDLPELLELAQGNPESRAFWVKNQFIPTGVEPEGDGYTMVVMQRVM